MTCLTTRDFACAGFTGKPTVRHTQHRGCFFGIEEKLSGLPLFERVLGGGLDNLAKLADREQNQHFICRYSVG